MKKAFLVTLIVFSISILFSCGGSGSDSVISTPEVAPTTSFEEVVWQCETIKTYENGELSETLNYGIEQSFIDFISEGADVDKDIEIDTDINIKITEDLFFCFSYHTLVCGGKITVTGDQESVAFFENLFPAPLNEIFRLKDDITYVINGNSLSFNTSNDFVEDFEEAEYDVSDGILTLTNIDGAKKTVLTFKENKEFTIDDIIDATIFEFDDFEELE